MKFVDRLARRLGYVKQTAAPVRARAFKAAEVDRLKLGWATQGASIDSEIYRALPILRARSRDLWANNEYAKRFVNLAKTNLIGPNGVVLQNKARRQDGTLDRADNDLIEAHWRAWSKKGAFDVTSRLSRVDAERLFVETAINDGEVLLRIVPSFDNEFGFAVQFIDTDRLDTNKNEQSDPKTGNRVIMGVELDDWRRPVAYHILRRHPNAHFPQFEDNDYLRIPAAEIIHAYICVRPEQTRGIPWMHAAMISLNDLGGYREAAVIASRVGAAKMGIFTSPDGEGYTGDDVDASGHILTDAEPGTFEQGPAGMKLETWNPTYPHEQFEAFNKAVLRGIAGAIGTAYHTLSSDLEGVNFSSARAGVLDERDNWQCLQNWLVQSFHEAIFPRWLKHQLTIGAINIPAYRYDKLNSPSWQPRRWTWVDPLKDEQANALAWGMRTKSLRRIIEERGLDPTEVWEEIAEDTAKLRELGIEPTLPGNIQFETTADEAA